MMRKPVTRSIGRSAFTIIELLVVITIIAILVSLLLAAVFRALTVVKDVNNRNELSQLAAAVAAFQNNFGGLEPPPSSVNPATDTNYIPRMFPQSNNPCPVNTQLSGDQALVFFLGGVIVNGVPTGFSSDPRNPWAAPTPGEIRRGPFFNFIPNRLANLRPGAPSYLDYYNQQPFVYFSCYGAYNGYQPGDCPGTTTPYLLNGEYFKPNSFQIISAGPDGKWGPGGNYPAPAGPGYDDVSNFATGKLGIPN